LQALSQTGLEYAAGPYDRERYEAVQRIAAEMAAWAGGEEPVELLASFAAESGYRTPKVDVRGVVLGAEGLLLVREPESDWCLPGGWADVGETPSRAVEKEVGEEAGVSVRAVRLLGIFDRDFRGRLRWPAHVYKLYVQCEPLGGSPSPMGWRRRQPDTSRSTRSRRSRPRHPPSSSRARWPSPPTRPRRQLSTDRCEGARTRAGRARERRRAGSARP
jgi:ADP-ribose pyrophosphatase YjhB (NUDIX family)